MFQKKNIFQKFNLKKFKEYFLDERKKKVAKLLYKILKSENFLICDANSSAKPNIRSNIQIILMYKKIIINKKSKIKLIKQKTF